MYDAAIIGAGIIGTIIARELSGYRLKIALIEKYNDVSNGTTKANSGIIHAGYDAEPGSNKAKFNALGNPMFDGICRELDVPFKRIGSLVVGFDKKDFDTIDELFARGIANGIPELKILGGREVKAMEPNLSDEAVVALWAPTAGIIDPWDIAIAAAENAAENGVELLLDSEVTGIERLDGGRETGYRIITPGKKIEAKYAINCTGVYADEINNMVSSARFEITPRRGQYFVLDKSAGGFFGRTVFQCPTELGKGVLVTPSVHGNLLVGPDAQNLDDKENVETTAERLLFVRESVAKTSAKIPFNSIIRSFAGLRASPKNKDFIIGEAEGAKGFINVAGIESPGLSAAPAIARHVAELVKGLAGGLEEKAGFNPRRRKIVRFMELGDDEKTALIKKDSSYGRIICRCENVTEGEIVDAIRRKAGATTVNGVKRRVRPGMGRCQGGFCEARVMEILARELGRDMLEIVKEGRRSYILTGRTKGGREFGN